MPDALLRLRPSPCADLVAGCGGFQRTLGVSSRLDYYEDARPKYKDSATLNFRGPSPKGAFSVPNLLCLPTQISNKWSLISSQKNRRSIEILRLHKSRR